MAWAVEKKEEVLAAVEDLPDAHDPRSDLSLFLAQKIKHEIKERGSARQWSQAIQDDLIRKILPDFQNRFPHYRLGAIAVKRTWERLSSLVQQISRRDGAVTRDGKLDLPFFIRENLRCYKQLKTADHPFHFAHKLATKISECLALHDGVRLKLDPLARLIWSMQRHLLKGEVSKCHYDELDASDKVIVKTILEISAEHPDIAHADLEERLLSSLKSPADPEKVALNIRIDNPTLSAEAIRHMTQLACKRFDEARTIPHEELARKANLWSMQGDLICRCIQIDPENPLLKRIAEKKMDPTLCVHLTLSELLAAHPDLKAHEAQVKLRLWTYTKYAWYTLWASPDESSLDRFLKWHLALTPTTNLCDRIEATLPLLPFSS